MNVFHRIGNFFSSKEKQFIPNDDSNNSKKMPPTIIRKWNKLVLAMEKNDMVEVDSIQQTLLRSGYEAPTTLSRVRELIEKYSNGN